MFCQRKANSLVNTVQDRAVQIAYNYHLTIFTTLLSNNYNETTIHQRNLQVLMMEISEKMNDITPSIMSSSFEIRENTHNIRHFEALANESRGTVNHGLETICPIAPSLWEYHEI